MEEQKEIMRREIKIVNGIVNYFMSEKKEECMKRVVSMLENTIEGYVIISDIELWPEGMIENSRLRLMGEDRCKKGLESYHSLLKLYEMG